MAPDGANESALVEKYAAVILRVGLNLQPGQTLMIGGQTGVSLEAADVVRHLVAQAYDLGAHDVHIFWEDSALTRLRLERAPIEALSESSRWKVGWLEELSDKGAAFLSLNVPNPDLLAGVDVQRLSATQRARAQMYAGLRERVFRGQHVWSVAAVPTAAWARKVYPQLGAAQALAALWDYVSHVTRTDQPDPVAAWRAHVRALEARKDALNRAHFARLHYSAPGTDLSIELPERHLWIGASAHTPRGIEYVPNVPTEEVFTLPHHAGVDGTVRSTLPLYVEGQLIEGIRLTFAQGRIVDGTAETGESMLRQIIERDEGSHHLGEVALVPVSSPCNVGFPLYSTLFDENASCHLAIGNAYAESLEGGARLSQEELAAAGANASITHVDFMIGSAALDIDGETATGERVPIFRQGLWAEEIAAE